MKNKQFIILAVVCVVTLLPFMGLTDFHTKGEPREAIVAYSMIETGNWTLPVNNGGDIAYKPPLFHWCIAALSSIAGKVTEYTSRMPSALALIAMVLGGFLFYAKRRGASVALLMGLITLSNFEVHRAGMNCRVDMMLTAFIVLALYQLYRWCGLSVTSAETLPYRLYVQRAEQTRQFCIITIFAASRAIFAP